MSDSATTASNPPLPAPDSSLDITPPASEPEWAPADSSHDELIDSLAFAYRPTWNLRHSAVTTYECVPVLAEADGKRRVGDEIPGLKGKDSYRLDLNILQRSASDLGSLLASKQQCLMVIPVHFETLSSIARRADYLACCRKLIAADNVKYVAFELMGVPEGIVMARFHEVTAAVRRSSRALLLRLANSRAPFPPARESGLAAVGYESRCSPGGEAREIEDMQRFAVLAQRAGISSFLHGVRSLSLASAAVASGVGFINGDAIAPLIDAPRTIYNFDVAGLYAQSLGS